MTPSIPGGPDLAPPSRRGGPWSGRGKTPSAPRRRLTSMRRRSRSRSSATFSGPPGPAHRAQGAGAGRDPAYSPRPRLPDSALRGGASEPARKWNPAGSAEAELRGARCRAPEVVHGGGCALSLPLLLAAWMCLQCRNIQSPSTFSRCLPFRLRRVTSC